jgi:hypothetical protein
MNSTGATRAMDLRSWAVPWAGLAFGPIAWALNTQINYSLVGWACSKGSNPVPAIAAALALISIVGAASSFGAWERNAVGKPGLAPDGRPRYLLSGVGIASGVLFAIVIAMQGLAGLVLEPCVR